MIDYPGKLKAGVISKTRTRFFTGFTIFLLSAMAALPAFAQTTGNAESTAATTNAAEENGKKVTMPAWTAYREVKLGMSAEEVRKILGKPKIDDKDGFYYEISDDEFVQIRLDNDKKVRIIAATYTGGKLPQYGDVFGAEAEPPTKPDGSIYNLVRYPEAGFWIAYSRRAGEKPAVTVTMQKIDAVP
jgi:outer membrane protein assembly factor BamE (lipoprotein component of BamABCDE complex)